MSLADDLRQAAALIDLHPELEFSTSGITFYAFAEMPFTATVRALAKIGRADKERSESGLFKATVKVNESVEFVALDYFGSVVCERVQTGVERVERPVMVQTGVEVVEQPVYAWKCPESILAGPVEVAS